jgi:hypothetical protein
MENNNIDTISTSSSNNCSICLVSLKDNTNTLKCNHTFHNSCLELWLNTNNTCPLCRAIINTHNKKIFLPDNQSNMIPHLVVNINHINNINNINPINNIINNCNNIKKNILMRLAIFSILFNICAIIYFTLTILINNNTINKIINHKNETDPDYIDNNTFDGSVLLFFNVIYIIIYIILNLCIYNKKWKSNKCAFIFIICLAISICILNNAFYDNTNKFIKKNNELLLSFFILLSSFITKLIFNGFSYIYNI